MNLTHVKEENSCEAVFMKEDPNYEVPYELASSSSENSGQCGDNDAENMISFLVYSNISEDGEYETVAAAECNDYSLKEITVKSECSSNGDHSEEGSSQVEGKVNIVNLEDIIQEKRPLLDCGDADYMIREPKLELPKSEQDVCDDTKNMVGVSSDISIKKEYKDEPITAESERVDYSQTKTTVKDENNPEENSEEVGDAQVEGNGKNAERICRYPISNDSNSKSNQEVCDQERNFKCEHCEETFSTILGFKNHSSYSNVILKTFKCTVCAKVFSQESCFTYHMDMHSKCFRCLRCGKTFQKKESLSRHRHSHSEESLFKCSICAKTFSKRRYLARHKRSQHTAGKPRPFQCSLCNMAFTSKKCLRVHLITHSGGRKFECDHCKKIFKYKFSLKAHSCPQISDLACPICKEIFQCHQSLKEHMILHRKYECCICQKSRMTKKEIRFHMVSHITERKFTCFCGKTFKLKSGLIVHMDLHMGVGKFTCAVCDATFRHMRYLKIHVKLHMRGKAKCSICSKVFSRNTTLKAHIMNMHSDEKKFKCEICSRSFALKSSLYSHMISHATENSFKCSFCPKSFRRNHSLKNHMHNHANEGSKVSFLCLLCHRAYFQKSNLSLHMSMHLNERNFKCPTCGKLFNTKHHLNIHIKNAHAEFECPVCKEMLRAKNYKSHLRSHEILNIFFVEEHK